MDGNKPKHRVEKPVDNQSNLTLKSKKDEAPPQTESLEEQLDIPQPMPNYTPRSFYTRKQPTKALAKKRRKIARKSKQVNRRQAKTK